MDTKTVRRDFYQNKTFLNSKHYEPYTTERFSDDIQYMLDQFIPNATLKQLTKFMEKKFNRIIKSYPEVEGALKKVLKDKFNKMTETIKKQQIQKILNFFKQLLQDGEFVQNNGYYKFQQTKKRLDDDQFKPLKAFNAEDVVIELPANANFTFDESQKVNPQKPCYRFTWTDQKLHSVGYFASTMLLTKESFSVNRGNFERQANNFLDKLIAFDNLANVIQSKNS